MLITACFLFISLISLISFILIKNRKHNPYPLKGAVSNKEDYKNRYDEYYDCVIRNGTVYNGYDEPPKLNCDVAIHENRVVAIGKNLEGVGVEEIDANGCIVMPGMLDIHAHYDLEIERHAGIGESIRHGVTTVVFGNCSISAALGNETDLLELFSRVENLPIDTLKEWIPEGRVNWKTISEYYDHLDSLNIGCNVSSFIGHSNIRFHVMGLERSLMVQKPTKEELDQMKELTQEAIDSGALGISIDLLPFHRMTGRYVGISIPSQQASFDEYRQLADIVRENDSVLQATPNAIDKKTFMKLFILSTSLFRHKKTLKCTLLASMDIVSNKHAYKASKLPHFFNKYLGANIRFQTLAAPFEVYTDGTVTPFAEELNKGVEAMNTTEEQRKILFQDPQFRKEFKSEWLGTKNSLLHSEFDTMFVVSCDNEDYVGKSFTELTEIYNYDSPMDFFMDQLAEYGDNFRWKTVLANGRPDVRNELLNYPSNLPGFNDSGAHSRNMAFYNGGLRMIRDFKNSKNKNYTVERAVHRLTYEAAEYLNISDQVGLLLPNRIADIVIIDPSKLDSVSDEAVMCFDEILGAERLVNRNDDQVVKHVFVGGVNVFSNGEFNKSLGKKKFGRLIKVNKKE